MVPYVGHQLSLSPRSASTLSAQLNLAHRHTQGGQRLRTGHLQVPLLPHVIPLPLEGPGLGTERELILGDEIDA